MNGSRSASRGWQDHLLFLGRFLRSPRTVGAIAPSSRRLARGMIDGLDLGGGVRMAELGPGTGSFTSAIAARLAAGGRCLAVERDETFARRLDGRWPAIDCVADGAERLAAIAGERNLLPLDHIVSGLPFASLPGRTTRTVMDAIRDTLKPGGTFTTFQYLHAYWLPPAVGFRRAMTERMGREPSRTLIVGNLPPAFVLRWRRADQGVA